MPRVTSATVHPKRNFPYYVKMPDMAILGDILQSNWLELFQSVRVIQVHCCGLNGSETVKGTQHGLRDVIGLSLRVLLGQLTSTESGRRQWRTSTDFLTDDRNRGMQNSLSKGNTQTKYRHQLSNLCSICNFL